jgi:hypothetical protein
MLCFHGMTESAFKQFQGFDLDKNVISPWVCSDGDGMTYVHTLEFSETETGEDGEYAIDHAIQQAKESGIIQAAVNDDSIVYVLEVNIPNEILEVDFSCNNMEHCRCLPSEEFNQYAKNAKIHEFSINKFFHVFRLAGFVNHEQFNWCMLDDEIYQAAKVLSSADYSNIYDSLY